MIIMHNIEADNASRVLGGNLKKQSKALEKLSSGFKINRAGDNAAGLSISEKMRAQIRGLNQASNNMQDGVALIQTAEGALNEVHSMVQRIREISVQAANGTNTEEDKDSIQDEINQLIKEVDNVSKTTSFNGIKLLDGSLKGGDLETRTLDIVKLKDIGVNIEFFEDRGAFTTTKKGVDETGDVPGNLKTVLKNEIVPRAVEAIVTKYSSAFGYLKDSSIGIGLEIKNEPESMTLASVAYGREEHDPEDGLYYKLTVNTGSLTFDGENLDDDSRRALETTIVHEMIHGFMDEALTNGMLGYSNNERDKSNSFPLWFIEGMAQTAAGGYSNDNDWVNGKEGYIDNALDIRMGTSESEISAILRDNSHKLSVSNKDTDHISEEEAQGVIASRYGTGYLACMYLGYLNTGMGEIDTERLTRGVDDILRKLEDGDSLNKVINDLSSGEYAGIADFEKKFGDSESSKFVAKLTQAVGVEGNGGLASGNITDKDLLPNSSPTIEAYKILFGLDTDHKRVYNVYPSDVPVLEGGGSKKSPDGTIDFETADTEEVVERVGGLTLQVGANNGQVMNIEIDSASASSLGIDSVVVTSKEEAQEAMKKCDIAIKKVSTIRSTLGAYQNRLEHAISNVDNAAENTQSAESRIRDADMAKEMVKYSKFNVLVQAAQSMLAQSNQSKQSVLKLLQ